MMKVSLLQREKSKIIDLKQNAVVGASVNRVFFECCLVSVNSKKLLLALITRSWMPSQRPDWTTNIDI